MLLCLVERRCWFFSVVRMLLYDRLVDNNQLFNISLWDSERAKLFVSSPHPGDIILFMLSICLLAFVVLGFGLYIWFFITSSEHSQVRLLNILNVYFSAVCIGGGVNGFIILLSSYLGYYNTTGMTRISALFVLVAISAILLLISLATVLNHFKPEIYLDLSVAWRHSVALPCILSGKPSKTVDIFYTRKGGRGWNLQLLVITEHCSGNKIDNKVL